MTPSMWDFKLSPDQAMHIAIVSLNWAMVDHGLGMILAAHTGFTQTVHAAELVFVLDVSKKVEIIRRRHKRGEFPAAVDAIMGELNYIDNNYRNDRNMLAHGMLLGEGDDGEFWSAAKLRSLPTSALKAIASEAQYAAHVAHHLFLAVHGVHMPQSLPPRPPERSPEP